VKCEEGRSARIEHKGIYGNLYIREEQKEFNFVCSDLREGTQRKLVKKG
jgi:hypothetical protein